MPSKRLKKLVPQYQKVVHGERIAHAIGLNRIRAACPHVDD